MAAPVGIAGALVIHLHSKWFGSLPSHNLLSMITAVANRNFIFQNEGSHALGASSCLLDEASIQKRTIGNCKVLIKVHSWLHVAMQSNSGPFKVYPSMMFSLSVLKQ